MNLSDVLEDFITGSGVERAKLELRIDNRDVTGEFMESLRVLGYKQTTVADINVRPGERIPAFYIDNSIAYFGWVFWEKFTDKKMRKLWGSNVRNSKGDWAIQIPPTKGTPIYADSSKKFQMDLDKPV